jgi:3-oxoacyl-[acyl-carrier protein] reductase
MEAVKARAGKTPFSLIGRRALVTGASQGIGKATCEILARCGADVALVFLRRADEVEDAAEEAQRIVAAHGHKTLLLEADVTRAEDLAKVEQEVVAQFGGVDILVNCAGGFPTPPKDLVDLEDSDWDRSIELNLRSVFTWTRAFGRRMRAQGYGRIVSLSSGGGVFGLPQQTHYSASKAGIVAMTKAMARELGPYGITCNVVTPGRVDTPMSRIGVDQNWWKERPLDQFPIRRTGTAEDVAGAICYFASDEASWVTGQILQVNGGSFM